MTGLSRVGWKRVVAAAGLSAAVLIPVVVWIARNLDDAANVAEVVSVPLTVAAIGLAAWPDAARDNGAIRYGEVRRPAALSRGAAALVRIGRWCRWRRGRLLVSLGVVVVLAAALIGWDHWMGSRPGADLLARVPADLSGDCGQVSNPGAVAASATLRCTGAGGQEVLVSLFPTAAEVDKAYGEIVRQANITRGSGDCARTTGAEHRYPGIVAPVGRALCYQQGGNANMVWTNDAMRTVAAAVRRDGNDSELYRFWSALVGVPSFPTADERALRDVVEEPDCQRAPAGSLDAMPGVIAAIECDPKDSGAATVSYYRFADLDGLRRSYNAHVSEFAPPVEGQKCAVPDTLAEADWTLRSATPGRLLCYSGPEGELVMEWTVEPMLIVGHAVGTDAGKLGDWWSDDSGPPNDKIVAAINVKAGFPDPAERTLLDHIPAASRVDCMRPAEDTVSEDVRGTPLAAAVCSTQGEGPDEVRFYLFPDSSSMAASYHDEVSPGPDCTSRPPDFTGDAAYSTGTVTGRLGCATNEAGFPYLVWTHDQLNIMAFAFQDEDPAPLLAWWRAAAGQG